MGYLDQAIQLDPQFAAAYLERGMQRINHGDPQAALDDLVRANSLSPASPLVYLYLAEAEMALGRYDQALESAKKANELDITLLPAYLVLGQAYSATGQLEKAVGALQTYTLYQPDDPSALIILGAAYNAAGDYNSAISALDRAIGMDKKLAEAYYQRGMANLGLEELDLASRISKLQWLTTRSILIRIWGWRASICSRVTPGTPTCRSSATRVWWSRITNRYRRRRITGKPSAWSS
jgi:tetratricopeptide (TPR) repeat protein